MVKIHKWSFCEPVSVYTIVTKDISILPTAKSACDIPSLNLIIMKESCEGHEVSVDQALDDCNNVHKEPTASGSIINAIHITHRTINHTCTLTHMHTHMHNTHTCTNMYSTHVWQSSGVVLHIRKSVPYSLFIKKCNNNMYTRIQNYVTQS